MDYRPQDIEPKWQAYWQENQPYASAPPSDKPKFYALDMFPYPSGAGLHVGHPLGYIATDILARYKRMKGFNVLHPMGFDSFGLPAEQYAIETGQHPAITTAQNIQTFKKQLGKLGFDYDWNREVQTSDPQYYRWTQWIFLQLFDSWYNLATQKAEPLSHLRAIFEEEGNQGVQAACEEDTPIFSAAEWRAFSEKEKAALLLRYRLTYLADEYVNWCPALGTVLANDEVKDGLSERGGHPVERKKMRQWMMRITAYAERLLEGLERIDWSEAIKEMQRNWIGKSRGCEIDFAVVDSALKLTAFTTRIDTIYGVSYLVLAPELDVVAQITTEAQAAEVAQYVNWAKNRSERERQTEVKTVSGVFTGAFALNPFNQEKIPIWVADYVLAGYGTGVVMGVPSSDERDFRFATHFQLPIRRVIAGTEDLENPTEKKYGPMINSGFLDGLETEAAIDTAIQFVLEHQLGKAKTNYRLRDAVFSRQRYWGEPVPVYFAEGLPYPLPETALPLSLPNIDEYKPTSEGEPPLKRAQNWHWQDQYPYETTTMPGWAGSSWYFLRYADPHNQESFAARAATDYWGPVDVYIGGTEHAVGHLLYSRFWTKFLYDRGFIGFDEPFQKLINQGMIQGQSALIYRVKEKEQFVSADLKADYEVSELHVDVKLVENGLLDLEGYQAWRPETAHYTFLRNAKGQFLCDTRVEKMSKRWYNVVNPDDVVARYGADTMRLFEMFLGPLEQSKPWDPKNITGCYNFLRKFWRLFWDDKNQWQVKESEARREDLKVLHFAIKRVEEDIERYSFNTVVSTLMTATNELTRLACHSRAILDPMIRLLAPYAPHLAEELWHQLGHTDSVHHQAFPTWEAQYLVEDTFDYPMMINGKKRGNLVLPLEMPVPEVEQAVQASEIFQKWSEGRPPKKIIMVKGRVINVVV